MTLKDIPEDSFLLHWLYYLQSTEIPLSYQITGGLSTLGCVLRRQRWIDQFEWRVYPNQSVMFIGPSGVGKDTIINRIRRSLDTTERLHRVPTIGGVTLENIYTRLAGLGKPAAAYIPAAEMTAFFGKADYQQNMLTGFTDILSTGGKIDITTKGMFIATGQPKYIHEPTVTMHAGSTVEWLHKAMPSGTMEGGFLGRFLIIAEEFGGKHVPLVKRGRSREELDLLSTHLDLWNGGMEETITACAKGREMILYDDAEDLYANWYHNRFRYFSKVVTPYANRSRDMVLRLAMLMALSRRHWRWIEAVDVQFAIDLMHLVAARIDHVAMPPSQEGIVAQKLKSILPATLGEIYVALGMAYSARIVDAAMDLLRKTGEIEVRNSVVRLRAEKEE